MPLTEAGGVAPLLPDDALLPGAALEGVVLLSVDGATTVVLMLLPAPKEPAGAGLGV